jgi:hypothetical protein
MNNYFTLITSFSFLFASCTTVSSIYNINQPLMNTEYHLVGHVSANCDKDEYQNTYDYLMNKALNKYGEGIDIINITKDYEGSLFSTQVYINAHVIKYLNTVDFQTYNLANEESDILDSKAKDVSQKESISSFTSDSDQSIKVGMTVKVDLDGKIVDAEIIKVMEENRYAISFKDSKGKTVKKYISKNQIID